MSGQKENTMSTEIRYARFIRELEAALATARDEFAAKAIEVMEARASNYEAQDIRYAVGLREGADIIRRLLAGQQP